MKVNLNYSNTFGIRLEDVKGKVIDSWEQETGIWKEQVIPEGETLIGVYGKYYKDKVGLIASFGFITVGLRDKPCFNFCKVF